jgi:hypothetical protein
VNHLPNSFLPLGDPNANYIGLISYYSDNDLIQMYNEYPENFEEIFIGHYVSNKRMLDKEISNLLDGDFFKDIIIHKPDFFLKLVNKLLTNGVKIEEFIIKISDLDLPHEHKRSCLELILKSGISFIDPSLFLRLYLTSCFISDQEKINEFSKLIKGEDLLNLNKNFLKKILKQCEDLISSKIGKEPDSILNNNLNLIIASLSGNYERIQKLLNSDLDIESIHLSALAGIKLNNIEIVKLLITDSRIKDSPDFFKLLLEQELKNFSKEMRDLLNANFSEFWDAKRRPWRMVGSAVLYTAIVIFNGVQKDRFPSLPIMLSPIAAVVLTESAIFLSNPNFLKRIGSKVYNLAIPYLTSDNFQKTDEKNRREDVD